MRSFTSRTDAVVGAMGVGSRYRAEIPAESFLSRKQLSMGKVLLNVLADEFSMLIWITETNQRIFFIKFFYHILILFQPLPSCLLLHGAMCWEKF